MDDMKELDSPHPNATDWLNDIAQKVIDETMALKDDRSRVLVVMSFESIVEDGVEKMACVVRNAIAGKSHLVGFALGNVPARAFKLIEATIQSDQIDDLAKAVMGEVMERAMDAMEENEPGSISVSPDGKIVE